MTQIEMEHGMLPFLIAMFRKAVRNFKKQATKKRNLRYLLYYAIANLVILLLFSLYQSMQPVHLDIKPMSSPATEGSFLLFIAAVILLPLSLLFEELGFRFLPMFFMRDVLHLNSITISVEDDKGFHEVHNTKFRHWLYVNWLSIYIVVSSLWAGLLHQINITNSDALGALIYFGVQTFSGAAFSWIYSRRGLGASWAVHVSWDYFLIFLNLIIIFLG